MQLRPDVFEGHLKQTTAKGLTSLYMVHSGEHLLALETVDALRQVTRAQGFTEYEVMNVERSFSWSHVAETQQSMSLFGDRRIVELRIPSSKPGKDGGEALRTLAVGTSSKSAADTVVLITLPCLDFMTAKSAWSAALEGTGVSVKVGLVDRTRPPGWTDERLTRQQQHVESGEPGRRVLQFITNRMEGSLSAVHQKTQKLDLLYPPGMLMFDDVYDAILNVARYDVFKPSEVMLADDVPRLVRMLEELRGENGTTVLVL